MQIFRLLHWPLSMIFFRSHENPHLIKMLTFADKSYLPGQSGKQHPKFPEYDGMKCLPSAPTPTKESGYEQSSSSLAAIPIRIIERALIPSLLQYGCNRLPDNRLSHFDRPKDVAIEIRESSK